MPNYAKITPVEVLDGIEDFMETNGYPPTYRDLAESLNVSLSTIYIRVERLAGKGLVEKRPRCARGLSVTEEGLCMLKREGRLAWR